MVIHFILFIKSFSIIQPAFTNQFWHVRSFTKASPHFFLNLSRTFLPTDKSSQAFHNSVVISIQNVQTSYVLLFHHFRCLQPSLTMSRIQGRILLVSRNYHLVRFLLRTLHFWNIFQKGCIPNQPYLLSTMSFINLLHWMVLGSYIEWKTVKNTALFQSFHFK